MKSFEIVNKCFHTELGTPFQSGSFELIQCSAINHPPKLTPRTGTCPARMAY